MNGTLRIGEGTGTVNATADCADTRGGMMRRDSQRVLNCTARGRMILRVVVLLLAVVLAAGVATTNALGAAKDDQRATGADAQAGQPGRVQMGATTAADIDTYLAAKGSPMAGNGAAFITSGSAWKVDPRLLVAIAGAESNFGQITCGDFNAWGYGCPNNPFGWTSWADAIDTVTKGLRTNYLAEGRTSVVLIQQKYAPSGAANDPTGLNNNWVINVSRFLIELGGDPQNIDLSGVAGSRPVGIEIDPGTAATDFDFTDAAASDRPDDSPDVASTGKPLRITFRLTNAGSVAWTPANVRIRRVDIEPHVASAPFAVLDSHGTAPGRSGTFVVQLVPAGSDSGTWQTTWRLEGPGGPVGEVLVRDVRTEVADLVAGESRVSAPQRLSPGEQAAVVIKLRNAGANAWNRDGGQSVALGVRQATGPSLATSGWLSPEAPARLLERAVEPGEWGSFAFPITAHERGTAALELAIFRDSGWGSGTDVRFSVVVG